MKDSIYLDTNFLIYGSTDKDSDKKASSQNLVKNLKKDVCTSILTWDEYVHIVRKILGKQMSLIKSKEFLKMDITLLSPNRETLRIANNLLDKLKPRDAIHAATMIQHGIKTIISDDPDFDKIKEIKRIKLE